MNACRHSSPTCARASRQSRTRCRAGANGSPASPLTARTPADPTTGRNKSSSELTYPTGISLLSLKNHLLLSYLHHLLAVFALKLNAQSLTTGPTSVVDALVRLRVVLEKIGPLEGKLKYQIEKLVRRADQAADAGNDEDLANGASYPPDSVVGINSADTGNATDPLAFRPNPANLVSDRHGSDDDGEHPGSDDDSYPSRAGIYRPPRVAAMPYSEAPAKGTSPAATTS